MTIEYQYCGLEMNVALGTFGTGMPEKCPECGHDKLLKISDGWNTIEKK